MARYEDSNFAIYMWEYADPQTADLGKPPHEQFFSNIEDLERRMIVLKDGRRFNYIRAAKWDEEDGSGTFSVIIDEWWRP